ncbi:MAG: Dabb family protein [Deltaproteobacteria bacterium]|nr:Dabb family protein [Deltaproteobacteria bacterium]TLN04500.1 MAG: Dabb family protein [bacterium]
MITHIVFFKLVESSPEIVQAVQEMLLSMQGKIPQLLHLEVGVDLVKSDRSYDLALVTRFASLGDLQTYQLHPYHAETVVPFVKKIAKSSVTVDYENK